MNCFAVKMYVATYSTSEDKCLILIMQLPVSFSTTISAHGYLVYLRKFQAFHFS